MLLVGLLVSLASVSCVDGQPFQPEEACGAEADTLPQLLPDSLVEVGCTFQWIRTRVVR